MFMPLPQAVSGALSLLQAVMMLRRIGSCLLGGICAVLVAGKTPGATLLHEAFNYPDGSLVSVAGGLWSTHSGIAGQIGVLSGRLDLRMPETEDVNVLFPGQPYNSTRARFCTPALR